MIVFRRARPGDFEVIKGILEKVGLITDGIEQHRDNFMVAEEDNIAIATGGLEIYGDIAILRSLAVLPEFQGRGIGDGLVRALINFAERRGVKKIFLYTRSAKPFFEKIGFIVAEPKDLYEKNIKSSQMERCANSSILLKLDVNDFFKNIKCKK
ncbi:amino-acid N-acetyltransferase [Caldanaerovirga acetigignens]|uniref:Amino-acid N-acetyltransferase n=1 Tax=Caldanaerovirga acetigignens TaxID=447595 RepID=A0A1M7L9T6_9FIRM|nr:GNAT family N-acetyltransferase [Caldanaerovirga acetigignens]SHM74561.1 amino-acid N-acetyltransferase [Caldanaerovirga acetigignens]